MGDDKQAAKLADLVLKARDQWRKLGDALDDLEAIAAGTPTRATEAKRLVVAFAAKWKRAYRGESYVIDFAKDIGATRALLTRGHEAAEIERRQDRFLACRELWLTEKRHPYGMFISTINRWGQASAAPSQDDFLTVPAADCRHRPACRSQQEHDDKRRAELRAGR